MKKTLLTLAALTICAPAFAQSYPVLKRSEYIGTDNWRRAQPETSRPDYNRYAQPEPVEPYRPLTKQQVPGYHPPPLRSLGNLDQRREGRGLTITPPVYPRYND